MWIRRVAIDGSCSASPGVRTGRADARREKVIAAARLAFAKNGFHATGIAQIAQASGVLVGQIYRDFANKEAIVAVIVARDLEDFLAQAGLSAAGQAGDSGAVRDWIARFVACDQPEGGWLIAEIMAEASRNDRIAEIVRNLHERLRRELTAALCLLVPRTVSAARFECVAEMIQTISAGVFQRRVTEHGKPSPAVIEALIGCINSSIDKLQAEAV